MAQTVKCLPTTWETWVHSLSQEDLLEKEMATHSSILAWKTSWTEAPGRLQSHRIPKSRTRLSDFTFKGPCRHPTPQQATTNPFLCWRLLDTHRQVWVSLFWVHYSFLLGPGAYKVLFVPSKSLAPVLCKFWRLYGGLMATSPKRAYAIPWSTTPRAADPAAVHCWPIPWQETLRQSSGSVSVGSLGPGVHKVCLSPLSISGRYGVWL